MYDYRAVVEWVRDGDTVRLRADLGFDTWHVGPFRIAGVAARELEQPGGSEAHRHLENLLPVGATVDLVSVRWDKYGGRSLARITLADGRDLEVLIANGWAARWDGRGVSAPAGVAPGARGGDDVTSRSRWRFAFLAVTALAIVMELVAAFDGRRDTDPWTSLIVTYVPAPITYSAIGLLALWLPVHFAIRYARRRAADRRSAAPPRE